MVSHFPWQDSQWHRLTAAARAGQAGHANLFSGREGGGHQEFADAFAKYLLCENSSDELSPCNECRSCLLVEAGNHPDLLQIKPEEEGKGIGIDQIRALSAFYSLKPHYAGNKVAIVSPADAMNRAAGNAILKTLEEPPAHAFLLLVTNRFDAISMTVRSRCQRLAFEHIEQPTVLAWLSEQIGDTEHAQSLLNVALGSPLKALALAEADGPPIGQVLGKIWSMLAKGRIGPLEASKQCADFSLKVIVEELLRLNYLMIVAKQGMSGAFNLQDEKPNRNLQALLDGLNLKDLYAISDVIHEGKRLTLSQANVRDSDLLDTIWIAIDDTYRQSIGA